MYQIGQACPWWRPDEDEVSGFELLVMVRIHSIYEALRRKEQVEMMGKMLGG